MTVIFVITKNKYFNVIEETAQTMCMDFINDNVWSQEFEPPCFCLEAWTMQGSKLGWSCGPSLPKLLADHQIVLCGGPVVYWKLSTIKKQYFDKKNLMFTHTFYDQLSYLFQ